MLTMLSIIIVNYNGIQFLKGCIHSIMKHVGCSYEIIVVDNASSDGSREYIKSAFPKVRLIESQKNLGFTGGNNLGVKHARGDLLILLNNDTRLLSDLKPAYDAFHKDEKVGVIGGRMFYGDGRQQPSIGYEHNPLRIIFSWLGLKKIPFLPSIFRREVLDEALYNVPQGDVAWVSGAFLMTRKSLWEELGGLDESYFMYVEDVDYCKRVRLSGYRVDYIPSMKVIHYEGAGKAWIGYKALDRTLYSYLTYSRKFYGPLAVLVIRFGLGVVFLMRSVGYKLALFISNSDVLQEKSKAFGCASLRLMFGGL